MTGVIRKEGNIEVCEYSYTYDISGGTLSETVSYDSESGKTTSYIYDELSRTISAVYTEDGDVTKVLESYVYDVYGRLTKSTKTDHTDDA